MAWDTLQITIFHDNPNDCSGFENFKTEEEACRWIKDNAINWKDVEDEEEAFMDRVNIERIIEFAELGNGPDVFDMEYDWEKDEIVYKSGLKPFRIKEEDPQ